MTQRVFSPPFVREGMTFLEPGPGMGFFTLELARRVMDQFAKMPHYVSPEVKQVVRISLNSLWCTGWMDFGQEPVVLSVPDTAERLPIDLLFSKAVQRSAARAHYQASVRSDSLAERSESELPYMDLGACPRNSHLTLDEEGQE